MAVEEHILWAQDLSHLIPSMTVFNPSYYQTNTKDEINLPIL